MQCVAVCCSELCCSVLSSLVYACTACLRLQRVHRALLRVYCSVLQCVAVSCSVLQCLAVSGVCVCGSFEGAKGA